MKQTVNIECPKCSATGLYCGFAEPKGTAVVCIYCNGTGCEKLTYDDSSPQKIIYTPFTSRKEKSGVHTVSLSRGSFVLSCGPRGQSISYNEFRSGKMPTT